MKAWQKQDFGLDNLRMVEIAIPKPGPKQLLVRVSAVSLNYRDKAIINGAYLPHLMNGPFIPVSDAAGVVVDRGKDVVRFKEGDRVTSHLFTRWVEDGPGLGLGESPYALGGPLDGGLAEYMLLDEEAAVATPPSLNDEEASTLPIAALTVWCALVEYGKLKAGETVLVQGTGGVSIFGVQIASALVLSQCDLEE
jgi:NADPH:quinone reductase-like Zn-dependent oxidoreductase